MGIPQLRRTMAGIALIAGLMAMALSCGGSAATAPHAEDAAASAGRDELREWSFDAESGPQGASGPPGAPGPAAAPAQMPAQPQAAALPTPAPAATIAPAAPRAQSAMAAAKQVQAAEDRDSVRQQTARQLIVEAWIGLDVNDIDATVRQVEALAAQRGGWVESAEIFGEAGYRAASVRLRVPADRLDNALDALRGLGRVTDEGVSSTDVTERLIDNEARLTAWYAQEEGLITLLENAPTVEDIIQIEQRLAEVRSDIEHVEATQRNLTGRVATSLITVNLHLPARFAADPPHGTLTLAVGDPSAAADSIATVVQSLNGYIGQKREYDEGRGRVVDMVIFVRASDLARLMDYAAERGVPSGRQLNSVGPSPASDVPNASLTLNIRSNVDLEASLAIRVSEPLPVAEQIRAQAVLLDGFVELWDEYRDDDEQRVNMEIVVKASDLRPIMDFSADLGDVEHWNYNALGQNPADDAPNARLRVSVETGDDYTMAWIIIGVVVGAVVVGAIIVVAVARLVRRRNRRVGDYTVANLEADADSP